MLDLLVQNMAAATRWLEQHLHEDECGQGLTEYAAVLIFISIVATFAMSQLGSQVSSLYQSVASAFP